MLTLESSLSMIVQAVPAPSSGLALGQIRMSVSVAVSLPGLVSLAALTVTVFVRLPVALGSICTVNVYVTLAPGLRLAIVSLSAPDPLVWPLPLQVADVTPAGSGSLTPTLVAVFGPALLTTI